VNQMEFDRQCDELGGKTGTPPGKEECHKGSAGWGRGVQMVMVECKIQYRGPNPDQGAQMGIEKFQSSRVAHSSGVANSSGALQNGGEGVSNEIEWLGMEVEVGIVNILSSRRCAERTGWAGLQNAILNCKFRLRSACDCGGATVSGV